MRNYLSLLALLVAFVVPAYLAAESAMPQMSAVVPAVAKSGDVLTVSGQNLDRANVAALYLTDGKKDVKVVIVEESATSIRFRIPPGVAPGRLALMVLTTGENPKFIEEPVKVTVQ